LIVFKLNQVIRRTVTSHIIIQTDCGININISVNFERSELGHVLKSSIINSTLAIHKSCTSNISTHKYDRSPSSTRGCYSTPIIIYLYF